MTDDPHKQDDSNFNDDELFDGLTDEDYNIDDESTAEELDDELSSGYVHESIDDEELYNYQDEEHPSDADEPTYPAKAAGIGGLIASIKSTLAEGSLTDKLRRLLIPVLLGMLILGFGIYKLAQLFSSPSLPPPVQQQQGLDVTGYIQRPQPPSDELTIQNSVKQPMVTQTVQPKSKIITVVQPAATTQSMPTTTSTNAPATSSAKLTTLEHITDDATHVSKKMGAQTASAIQVQLTQLQTMLTTLAQQQQQRSEQIHAMQQQLNLVNTELTGSTTTIRKALVGLYHQVMTLNQTQQRQRQIAHLNQQARKQYSIQAIISGRAWLKTQQGNVITVTQGDIVPGYGEVTDIDVDNGVVRTGSGAVFGYALSQ